MVRVLRKEVDLRPTDYELFTFEFIISRLHHFDGHYGHYCKLVTELKFKEYSTLKKDFEDYHKEVIFEKKNVNIKTIHSLRRSLQIMRGKTLRIDTYQNRLFINFLDISIASLETMIERLIDEIVASIEQ